MITTIKSLCASCLLLLVLAGCDLSAPAGDHGHAHDAGTDDHGHGGGEALVFTDYTDSTELFVEFPPFVAGRASTFAAHVTRLSDYSPLQAGVMDVILSDEGRTVARFRVREPARSGIFTPAVTPRDPGEFQLTIEVKSGELQARHELGSVTVFPDAEAATVSQPEPEGDISYLKEQQWVNPFAAELVQSKPMRRSVPGFATVLPPADASAVVRAPSDGYYSTAKIITASEKVDEGQALGYLVPRLGEGTDIGQLLVALERARSQVMLANRDVERLQDLYEQGAVPERRLMEAQQALEVARVELQTAQSRVEQQRGGKAEAGIALRAPVAGEVTSINVRPSAFVRAGDPLFSIADPQRRWLEVQVPERFASGLSEASGAWFQLEENNEGGVITLDADNKARVVQTNTLIDPRSRTASVTLEYPSSAGPTLIGSRFAAHVFSGETDMATAIPRSAVIDDAGQTVVYVQTGGETFARRVVVLGAVDSRYVAVEDGVRPGERVVSKGAYYVKLATVGGDAVGHGHAH